MAQVAVCSQINTKHINTVWAERTVVHHVTGRLWKVNNLSVVWSWQRRYWNLVKKKLNLFSRLFVTVVVLLCVVLLSCVYCYLMCIVVLCVYCCLTYFSCRTAGYKSVFGRSCDRPPRPQVFLGFPVSIRKCWNGSQDSKLPLHASHVALPT